MARVLFVEDEPAIQGLVREILGSQGHDVTVASDGAEALQLISGGAEFHLLLTDICMPRGDGIDLMRALKARGCRIPMVVVTGIVNPPRIMGISGIVQKPFRIAQLMGVIGPFLEKAAA